MQAAQKSKRVRHVFPTHEIPHLWMHQTQDDARNPQGNLYFENDTIYSYRNSFPIARHVTNERNQKAILFTTCTYSVTTSQQCSNVRRSIASSTLVFHVSHVADCWGAPRHEENVRAMVSEITEHIATASRARSSYNITDHLQSANRLHAQAIRYCEFFALECPALPDVPEVDSEKLAAIRQREREASARKAVEQREENERRRIAAQTARKEWEEKMPGLCHAWRNGEDVRIPSAPFYAWNEQLPEVPTMLRIVGDEVETSRGARVPVSHAKHGLAFVRRVVASGVEYRRNGHTLHLGHYPIDRIEVNGTLHAGCHRITLSEIERLASALESHSAPMVAEESEASHV